MKRNIIIAVVIYALTIAFFIYIINRDFLTTQQEQSAQTNSQPNSQPKQVEHRKTLWTSGMMNYEVIDGHHYIVTSIRDSGYGSFGITSVVHAESCPCKKKAENN